MGNISSYLCWFKYMSCNEINHRLKYFPDYNVCFNLSMLYIQIWTQKQNIDDCIDLHNICLLTVYGDLSNLSVNVWSLIYSYKI